MDYEEEIDILESTFRDPKFRENLTDDQMEDIQEVFFDLTRKLYNYNQAKKEGVEERLLEEINKDVLDALLQCRKVAGL